MAAVSRLVVAVCHLVARLVCRHHWHSGGGARRCDDRRRKDLTGVVLPHCHSTARPVWRCCACPAERVDPPARNGRPCLRPLT